jgi:ribose 5-phosphate isomerase RpiB
MIYTARQVEELWKANGSNGQVVLPYRARLTPMASDWIKAKRVQVGYSDIDTASAVAKVNEAQATIAAAGANASQGAYLWWCDGPCGTAKAALMGQAKEANLAEAPVPSDAGRLVAAIKHVAGEVKSGKASGGILMVQSGATALVYANRCPSLRAIVGTCFETVEQGIQQVAANVLVIEYPHKTLQQIRNLLSRFVKAKRELSDDVKRAMQELGSCG